MSDVEAVVREHARRVTTGDPRAREDLAPDATLKPADLLDHLLQGGFHTFELVAHARIGAHHLLKTKYVGSTTVVVQARWTQNATGRWQMLDAEVARVATGERA